MASQSEIASQMIAVLAASEPDLDTTTGSVARKIIDAVAGSISAATLDSQMLAYQYDVYSMTGAALDSFVQLFGMIRYPAARSVGVVTFTRGTATDVVTVPIASQVASADGTVVVQTLTAAVMNPADLSVSVPVQSAVAGPSGNVAAGSLTQLMTPASEVSAVTNVNALSGGANQETDSQLQARWSATAFKSMAGTSQMFLGIATSDPDCEAANVVDGATRFREQLQVSGGQAISTITDAQYVYPSGQVVGQDIDNGNVAAPGAQYNWNTTIPPRIAVIDATYFPGGQLIDASYLYMSTASRNNAADGIYNRVDVWCAGQRPRAASCTIAYSAATTFQASSASAWYVGSFVRPGGSTPAAGNVFVALPYGPIVTVPPVLVIGGVTYGLASLQHPLGTTSGGVSYAYQVVHRTGAYGWSPYSDFGLEWASSMQPPAHAAIVISQDYTFNDVPYAIQQSLENWRLAGTDVQAHQALQVPLQFSLAVIYDPSVTQAVTRAAIAASLQAYLARLSFDSWVYPSSVLQAVEGTTGVMACRFLTGADYAGYNGAAPGAYSVGIQAVYDGVVTGSYVDSAGNPVSIEFGDSTLPAYGGVVLVAKAANSFGSFA